MSTNQFTDMVPLKSIGEKYCIVSWYNWCVSKVPVHIISTTDQRKSLTKRGRPTVLTCAEEDAIAEEDTFVKYLPTCVDWGYPLTITEIKWVIFQIVLICFDMIPFMYVLPVSNPFRLLMKWYLDAGQRKTHLPTIHILGYKWWGSFLKLYTTLL